MSIAGIKSLTFAKKNTLFAGATPPSAAEQLFSGGLRDKGSLVISEFKNVMDHRERSLRNLINHQARFKSFQPSVGLLQNLLHVHLLDGIVDAEIVAVSQSVAWASSGGVFRYSGEHNSMALDFVYAVGDEEQSIDLTLEMATEYDRHKAIVGAAGTFTPLTLTGQGNAGISHAAYKPPYFMSVEAPTATILFDKHKIKSRKLTLSTKSEKDAYNRSNVSYIEAVYEIVSMQSDLTKLVNLYDKGQNVSLKIVEGKPAGTQTFLFNESALTMNLETTIGDENREVKATFKGLVPLMNITFGGVGTSAEQITFNP